MKKNTIMILTIILIVIIGLLIFQNITYATEGWQDDATASSGAEGWSEDATTSSKVQTSMDTDIKIGKTPAITSSKAMTKRILSVIQAVGSVLSVVALLVIGFRYMLSSIEERASMKGILIYYVIGAVLVFATSNILSVAYKLISDITI